MHNGGSATGNGDSLAIASRFEEYLQNDASHIYPPSNPYRKPARSTSHQDPINLTVQCLARLRERNREVENLRMENEALRSVNRELQNQLGYLIQASVGTLGLSSFASATGDDYNCSTVMKKAQFEDESSFQNYFDSGGGDKVMEDQSPTSVMEPVSLPLPKSISVRSREYLKMSQAPAASSGVGASKMTRSARNGNPVNASKVYVSQGKKDQEELLELEVYNQGMSKTELCNKWQQTGACPYGASCRFAHGMRELRPVIRHPRYKTEVCRMVLSGETCPYGHRCHFHHTLTEQEKFERLLKQQGPSSKR